MDLANKVSGVDTTRKMRGFALACSQKIVKVSDHIWAVPSASKNAKYAVNLAASSCTCEDYEKTGRPCKHYYAVTYHLAHVVQTVDGSVSTENIEKQNEESIPDTEKTPHIDQKIEKKVTYAQPSWKKYNEAQCQEKHALMVLLKDLCAGIPTPPYKGNGRPAFPWGDMIYAATMKVFGGLSGRRSTCDIVDCRDQGLIDVAPHFNTISEFLAKDAVTPLLQMAVNEAATPLAVVEPYLAADATGFHVNAYARWFDHKYGKQKKEQKWKKLHAMVGTKTNIIVAATVTDGGPKSGDSPQFLGLLKTSAERFPIREVVADKAYLGNDNVEAVEAIGATPYIPFRSNCNGRSGGPAWRRMFHAFSANREEFLAHYHRRSNVESVFSMLKRKFGSALRSKLAVAQTNEVLLKCLAHNLSVLVHEIHELALDPKFWMPRGVAKALTEGESATPPTSSETA